MENKEKQIEQIFNDIVEIADIPYYYDNKGHAHMDFVDLDKLAEKLSEKYQPKIPEDSVVLSREEYDELIKLKEENKKLNEEIDTFNHLCNEWVKINNKHIKENQHLEAENKELKNQLENKSKEMSEKWYNEVKKLYLENIGEQIFEHNWFGVQLNRFAKQCGVEIKES